MRMWLSWLGVLSCCFAQIAFAGSIGNVRIWPAPDHTRLVFDLSEPVEHKVFSLAGPDRIVIDLLHTALNTELGDIKLAGSPIQKIRSARRNQDDLRVVLDLSGKVNPKSFVLQPNEKYGHRLVLDLYNKAGKKPAATKKADAQALKRDILVMVDPGHGGEDPGALGPRGVREKDVVLAISRELQHLLKNEQGFGARLTRTGDYFVRLRQRTKIARDHNADLFVSIHADAFKSPAANGVSVFALSKRGATSETARWLAAKENSSDLIGGVGSVSLDDKDDVLAGVLLDLSMTASMKASLNVGTQVLNSMGRVSKLHKRRVEQAGFVVLKSPDIPSILVETGFISNPVEANRLNTKKYQRKIARSIYRGLQKYFTEEPPPGTLMAWKKQQKLTEQGMTHVIRRGDTLSEIAKENKISTRRLKSFNGLKNDVVKIGQVIKIPTS